MGNVPAMAGRESMDDDSTGPLGEHCNISEFEHTFPASLDDASKGIVPDPPEGYSPSTGPITPLRCRGSRDNTSINEPLVGRLITVHMLPTELALRETVGLDERTLATIEYASIRRLTWDHSRSSLKIGHGPSLTAVGNEHPEDRSDGESSDSKHSHGGQTGAESREADDPDLVFVSIRVENSLTLEDELKQRAKAEARRAFQCGAERPALPSSVYLGMFAGYTKPKPFQRKRPNLSFAVSEGHLPSLQEMRRWAIDEHSGSARPQINSLRPKLALDAVFLGENRFSVSVVQGLLSEKATAPSEFCNTGSFRSRYEVAFGFECIEVHVPVDCGPNVHFSYETDIDDWAMKDMAGQVYKGIAEPSGLELWILEKDQQQDKNREDNDDTSMRDDAEAGDCKRGCRRHVFLGIPDEDIFLARSSMEYFWNMTQTKMRLPPKAGSTHGRRVASMVTLRGEVKAPTLPTGRVDPVDLNGVEVRVGQVIQTSKRTGQLNMLPSPRALLGVEKKRMIKYNPQARKHWERVVLHQGWLRKRGGGAVKRWIWRYFVLYDTPQGHFLAYYNDVSDAPLFSEARRERQLVDMCQVCFLRPETRRPRKSSEELPPNAFTVVTTKRHWTLCADSQAGVLDWLCMLSVAVDEDVAVVDDEEALFHVKALRGATGGKYGPDKAATVHIGCMGMELKIERVDSAVGVNSLGVRGQGGASDSGWGRTMRSKGSASDRTSFWAYTDFFKWTLVDLHDGHKGLAIQCFVDDQFSEKENILLVTPKAAQLALVVEYQVEKFMSVMHLRLELPQFTKSPDFEKTENSNGDDTKRVYSDVSPTAKRTRTTSSVNSHDEMTAAQHTTPSTSKNFYRGASMNLETNVGAWGGTGMLVPGISASQAGGGVGAPADGGTNPFDSSSDDDGDEEESGESVIGLGLRGESDIAMTGPDYGAQQSEASGTLLLTEGGEGGGNNPFDFTSVSGMLDDNSKGGDAGVKDGVMAREMDNLGVDVFGHVDKTLGHRSAVGKSKKQERLLVLDGATTKERIWDSLDSLGTIPMTPSSSTTTSLPSSFFPESTTKSSYSNHFDSTVNRAVDDEGNRALSCTAGSFGDSAKSMGDTSQSSRIRQLFPSVPPTGTTAEQCGVKHQTTNSTTGLDSPTTWDLYLSSTTNPSPSSSQWPAPLPSPPTLPSTATGRGKALPATPTKNPTLANLVGDSDTALTRQTTSFDFARTTPSPAESHAPLLDFASTFGGTKEEITDITEMPRIGGYGSGNACTGPSTVEQGESGPGPNTEHFNPFASPDDGAFIAPKISGRRGSAQTTGKVIYENDAVRVVLDNLIKTSIATCTIALRYELQADPSRGASFSVDLVQEDDTPIPLIVSMQPEITAAVISESIDGRASTAAVGADAPDETTMTFHQELRVKCVRPFSAPPSIVLTRHTVEGYRTTNPADEPSLSPKRRPSLTATTIVPLPVTIGNFVEGLEIPSEIFRQKWTSLSSPDQVVQTIVQQGLCCSAQPQSCGSGSSNNTEDAHSDFSDKIFANTIKRYLQDSLGLAEVSSAGDTKRLSGTELVAAAGVLRTAASEVVGTLDWKGLGEGPSLGCLVGVEVNGVTGAARVAVKSANHVLAVEMLKRIVDGMRGGV